MGSSQHSPTVYLPVFVDTDKPSWLGDFNDAMNKIDSAFLNRDNNYVALSNRLTADETNITTLQGQATAAATNITNLQTSDATQNTEIATNTSSIGTINTHLTTLDGEVAANSGAITTLQTHQATDEAIIATNTSDIATNTTNISANTTELATHAAELAAHQSILSQIHWQILAAGTDTDTTNSSGEIGVYHAFGTTPATIHIEVQGAGSNLFHSIHVADSTHFIVRFENSDGTPYIGSVTFYYTVIG